MKIQEKEADIGGIDASVSDYYNGWYEADPERMRRCLHADLAKRAIKQDEEGKEYLRHLTKDMMVEATARGGGKDASTDKRHWTITILDSYEEIATVKVASGEYMEYIHLVKQDGQWVILNVIYTSHGDGQSGQVG